jgi:hypothetical protein
MIGRASAKSSTNKLEALLATCTRFINMENVRMAQYELIHQFKELGFPNIGFAQGTVQALYIGIFSTPTLAPQATSQSLLFTKLNHSQTLDKRTTSSAN